MKTTNKQNLLDATLVGTLAFTSIGTGATRFAKFYFTRLTAGQRTALP